MRSDVAKFPSDRQRNVTITLYPKGSVTWSDVIVGVATGGFDLSPFMVSGRHSMNEASFRLTWDGTGTFLANQPQVGDIIVITENSYRLWVGAVEELNNFSEERGSRTLSITCRSRDGVGPWRKRKYISPRFQQGGLLAGAAQEVIKDQGLEDEEFVVPLVGYTIPHTNVQFADINPWDALQSIGLAIGYEPFTDALGRVSFFSRDVTRPADIKLTQADVIRIAGGKGRPALSAFRLKWLDRNLTKVVQQSQVLGKETITAGFFRPDERRQVYWSDDRRARAQNTSMKVIQSVNDGLVNVGDESYTQLDRFHGEILVEVDAWVPVLATASIAAMLALDYVPDLVASFGGGVTIPEGRVIRGIAEASLLVIMMSMGNGVYEVWGEPFDFVHAINTTEAFDEDAPTWMEDTTEVSNDLIFDEDHAQEVAVRELLHRVAAGNRWDTVITDDPRIEPGDIIELPDTSRLYVTDYERDLTRGSSQSLRVSGFRA